MYVYFLYTQESYLIYVYILFILQLLVIESETFNAQANHIYL